MSTIIPHGTLDYAEARALGVVDHEPAGETLAGARGASRHKIVDVVLYANIAL